MDWGFYVIVRQLLVKLDLNPDSKDSGFLLLYGSTPT